MTPVHPAARSAVAAALCILPAADDGSKRPAVERWAAFQTTPPTLDELRAWDFAHRAGFGIIAGPVSGHRECWDFDDLTTYQDFVDGAHACGLGDVIDRLIAGYCDATPGGGRRVVVTYPVTVTWKDCTLARRPGRAGEPTVKTLIELPTFAIVAPSNGATHPSGRPYTRLSGDFASIASYTVEEREALFALARSFDQMPRTEGAPKASVHTTDTVRPGDDFNRRASWSDVLPDWPEVYRRGAAIYLRRPGKDRGLSASVNALGTDRLHVFTSSTPLDPDTSYSKFGAYAALHHEGDFSKAALALARDGYGDAPGPRLLTRTPLPDADDAPVTIAYSFPTLLARAATMPAPRFLVADLLPGDGTVLIASQPREYKTLIAQALCLAVTTGTPAFGLERLAVAEAVPAWFITEEDSEWHVTTRFGDLLRGYGLDAAPDLLHISAGLGLNFDAPDWQARILATARAQGCRLVVLDPLRSLTVCADQGPNELRPFALFARRLMRETGAVVLMVHHDAKPPVTGKDDRRRAQRASGGGIFSIADAPIHIERIDDTRRLIVPNAFKFSADPPPVTVRLEHAPGTLKLVGEDTTTGQPELATLDLRILDFLKHNPYTYSNAVARGVRARTGDVLDRLKALAAQDLVDSVDESKGIKWFTKGVA